MSEWTGPRVVLASPHETLSIQKAGQYSLFAFQFRFCLGCPFCAGRRVCAGNSLANFPQIVENWHPILNKKRPEEISSSSNEVVWIQCHNHPDHVYSKSANVLARSCKGISRDCASITSVALEKSHNQKPFCLICRGREVVRSYRPRTSEGMGHGEEHPSTNSSHKEEQQESVVEVSQGSRI